MWDPIPLGQTELACYHGSSHSSPPQFLKVVRYTATQVICLRGSREERYRLDNGRVVGDQRSQRWAAQITNEVRKEVHWHNLDGQTRTVAYAIEELARKVAHKDRKADDQACMQLNLRILQEIQAQLTRMEKGELP